ncbi:unnamed protein product [Sympodiomycopsis kandeliae]
MAGVNPYATGGASSTPIAPFKHPDSLRPGHLKISSKSLVYPRSEPLVSDKLYSGFVEHLGRGIYGGIVDHPEQPSPADLLIKQDAGDALTKDRLGFRKDVIKILHKDDGELQIPILRWPGGNFVSNYHWQDGIGPISQRPVRVELAWLSTESNRFGTDEFIDYCRALNVEPYFCLNMGTGTYEEALAWIEYCNGTGNTYWANLRRKNTGRDEPHNVKYWGLGNEVHGPWQIGHLSATDYTKMASRWAHGIKLLDPTVKLVSCGNQGNSEWDREVLNGLIGIVDYHSIHLYTMLGHERAGTGSEYEKNVFGPAAAERGIEICSSLIDLAKIESGSSILDWSNRDAVNAAREVKICYDEWNVWDEVKAPGNGSNGLEQWYDYTDMLGVVAWLNVLVRKSKEVGIACIAQSVNVISPVMTSPTGIVKQTTYHPLYYFSRYMKNARLLNLGLDLDNPYTGPTYPAWVQYMVPPQYIDVVGVIAENEKEKTASVRISVLNRHPEIDWKATLSFDGQDGFQAESAEIHELYSDDLFAKNTFENPNNIVPKITKLNKEQLNKKDGLVVRKHSFVFLIIEGRIV